MNRESAEILALQALGWLAEDAELMPRFLDQTGIGPDDLRRRATEIDVLGAVLDFLLQDEALVIAFSDRHGLPYTAPHAARTALPGGETVHWT
jgi:hypothetical protein